MALTLFAITGTAAFIVATPLLLRWAVDTGLGAETATKVDVNEGLLLIAASALVGAALLRGIFQFTQAYLAESVAQSVAYDIRNYIYDRLQSLSFAYHDDAETGQVMVRATQDVEVVRMFFNFGGIRLLFTSVLMVTVMTLMLIANWQVSLVAWAFMVAIAIRSFYVSRSLRPIWVDVQEGQARLGSVLQEALSGIQVVKAFAREIYESRKFGRSAEWLFNRSYRASMVQAVNQPMMSGLWMAALIATTWIGGIQVANGKMTPGELIEFLAYISLLQMPIRSLGWMVMMVPRAATAGSRIFEILDVKSDVQNLPGAHELGNPRGHIQFDHVSFSYDERAAVLSDVNFEASSGDIVALLGSTGSGKTTIVNLLPRFYDVSGGSVLFDHENVQDLTLESLRREVAIVQQDVFLFSATLRDNIAYGKPEANDEEVKAAAKLARIHDYIESLPNGYQTWVGERGATLSGGQKQRIAIARALLMDPRVLVFDDSTSSVDPETEFEIQMAMATLMEGRTTFIIAHRLRSLRNADQILVLDQGKIVQRGRHRELLDQGGLYREIYDLELRDQEEAFSSTGLG